MVDYSIAAIPTEYRGRLYRSRLEARWAAFFDRLGLAHEYEPFDLGAWSPDFLLADINALVEVKPITELDNEVWNCMIATACSKRVNALLLTMVAPRVIRNLVQIGWIAMPWRDSSMMPLDALMAWVPAAGEPMFLADIACLVPGGICLTDQELIWAGKSKTELINAPPPQSYTAYTMEMWARATSDVQWQPSD